MKLRVLAAWVRMTIIRLTPELFHRRIEGSRDGSMLMLLPFVGFSVFGFGLYGFFEFQEKVQDGYTKAWQFLQTGSMPDISPATLEGQRTAERRFDQLTRENAELKRLLETVLERVSPRKGEAPETIAARKEAVTDLVTDPAPAAKIAAGEIASGDISKGFDALENEARAAESKAAAKWRRLGALASGVDTTRARNAYEQAFKLDGSDFWTCVALARLREEAGDTESAKEAALKAVRLASGMRERAISKSEVADAESKLGNLLAAQRIYEEVEADFSGIAKRNPGSAEAQRDVAVSLNKLGDLLVKSGDLKGARDRYEEGLRVSEHLAAMNPGSAEAQRDLSVSFDRIGDVLVESGDFAGARVRYEESLRVSELLVEMNPGSAEAQRDLSVSLDRIGGVLFMSGDLAGARDRFKDSLRVSERLAEMNPGSAEALRDLIVGYANMGEMFPGQGWWAKANTIAERLSSEGRLAPVDLWMVEDSRQRAEEDVPE